MTDLFVHCRGRYLIALILLVIHGRTDLHAAESLAWHAVNSADVQGKGWNDTAGPFDRFPARAKDLVRPAVWQLSGDSSGLCVDFTTDATQLSVRWTLTRPALAMPHMPATGVSGVDLYVRDETGWQFVAAARPTMSLTNEVQIAAGLAAGEKQFRLYFPLYNGVSALELGVIAGSKLSISPKDDHQKPIVFYGTSIMQGGCASRPGMSYTSIISRRLGLPVINLGFSGNGKCEPAVAKLLAELDPLLFVLDPLPNLFPADAAQRLPEFVEIIRSERPQTPILLAQPPVYADAPAIPARRQRVADAYAVVAEVHRRRVENGDQHIFLAPGADLAEHGGEATVDGTHPTDLGFAMMADALEPHLRRVLQLSEQK